MAFPTLIIAEISRFKLKIRKNVWHTQILEIPNALDNIVRDKKYPQGNPFSAIQVCIDKIMMIRENIKKKRKQFYRLKLLSIT